MRRKIRSVNILISENFHKLLEDERKRIQNKMGLSKNISTTNLTEIFVQKRIKFPKLEVNLFQNAKRKKSRRT